MNKILQRLLVTNLGLITAVLLLCGLILKLPPHQLFFLLAAGSVLAVGLSLIVSKFFFKPIKQMKRAIEKIRQGDFRNRLDLTRQDELGELAHYLNEVSEEMQNKVVEIMQDKNELQAILSSMVEGVMVIDADENIILLNAPVYDMLELRSRHTSGKPYWEVIRNQEINALLKETILNKQSRKKDIALLSPEETQVSIQISPVLHESGKLAGVVAVFHDITELKKLERLRSDFVANVSHELKTPLTSIKGFVETLRDGAMHDQTKAAKFLEIIQKQTERLENLVNDLLSLSIMESRGKEIDMEPCPLGPVIESVLQLSRHRIEQKQQNLCVQIPENIPLVMMDRSRMEQVFLNLLDNAIKFTPSGGEISITATADKDAVHIHFKDTGIGIEAPHLPRLFERFYRVDKGRSRELGGTGLGLSIVKHTVQLHRGKVSVQSEPGQGSIFSVTIPAV